MSTRDTVKAILEMTGEGERPSVMDKLFVQKKKIVTSYVNPPIPVRDFDWCAHYDGEEEKGGYGYGATEQEAAKDFLANQDDE